MTRGSHRLAPPASRPRRIAWFAAPVVTCAAVGSGLLLSGSGTAGAQVDLSESAHARTGAAPAAQAAADREVSLSRSASRVGDTLLAGAAGPAARRPLPRIAARLWTTEQLDLRSAPRDGAAVHGELAALRRVGVTGVRRNGFAQVVYGGAVHWVTASYLAARKPTDPAHLGLADTPCAGTSGVEQGITPDAVRVYRAVCNNFPQITHYGGYDAHGEHSSGKALDIMTSDVAVGTAIAEFLQAHASELHLFDIIWRQHIWTPVRASEGWRAMPDRGSATANHFDHVHVSVY